MISKLQGALQNNWPGLSKHINGLKTETDGIEKNCSKLKDTKQTKQPKTIWVPQLDIEIEKKKSYKIYFGDSRGESSLG